MTLSTFIRIACNTNEEEVIKVMAKGWLQSTLEMLGLSQKKSVAARKPARKASRPAAKKSKVVKAKSTAKKVVKKAAKTTKKKKR